MQIQTIEQNRTIEELNKSQGKLERMNEKAEKQLNSVKSELKLKEQKANEEKEKAKKMLEVVSSEMKALRTTLAELANRERQVGIQLFYKCWVSLRTKECDIGGAVIQLLTTCVNKQDNID